MWCGKLLRMAIFRTEQWEYGFKNTKTKASTQSFYNILCQWDKTTPRKYFGLFKKRLFFKSQCALLKFDTHNYWIPYVWEFQLGTYHSGNKMENDLA